MVRSNIIGLVRTEDEEDKFQTSIEKKKIRSYLQQ